MTKFCNDNSGQVLSEYAIILGFIALLLIIIVGVVGKEVSGFFEQFVSGWTKWLTTK